MIQSEFSEHPPFWGLKSSWSDAPIFSFWDPSTFDSSNHWNGYVSKVFFKVVGTPFFPRKLMILSGLLVIFSEPYSLCFGQTKQWYRPLGDSEILFRAARFKPYHPYQFTPPKTNMEPETSRNNLIGKGETSTNNQLLASSRWYSKKYREIMESPLFLGPHPPPLDELGVNLAAPGGMSLAYLL